MNFERGEIEKLVADDQLDPALQITKGHLEQLPSTEFHKILDINWLPLAEPMAIMLDRFYKSASRKIKPIEALYCEMNAFTINFDNWFLEFFAYSRFSGRDNLDWLADYDYAKPTAVVFTNLEEVQSVYKEYIENEKWHDKTLKKAFEISEYHIILGVQQLFREAKKIGAQSRLKWTTIPVFVTAHDYDLIYDVTRI